MNYDSVPLRDFKDLDDWETVIFGQMQDVSLTT